MLISPLSILSPLGGSSGSSWTPQRIAATFLFDAETKDIAGGKLYNTVRGRAGEYLIVTGSAGSYHYACPNTPDYVNADTDYAWFKTNGSVSDMTDLRLNSYDLQRTLTLYNGSPYTNKRISILLPSTVITAGKMLNELFITWQLPIEWHNDTNGYGYVKTNRPFGQTLWPPESLNPAIPTGLIASLISGGVKYDWTAGDVTAQTEVWCRNDSDAYTTVTYTINAGTVTKSETITPVDLRYCKIRSLKGGLYSAFTAEVSIAMLSIEMISNSTFADAIGWDVANPPWNISGGKANYTTGDSNVVRTSATIVLGSKYRVKFSISGRTTTANFCLLDGGGNYMWGASFNGFVNYANGDYSYDVICTLASVLFGLWGQGGSGSFSVDNVSLKKILMP